MEAQLICKICEEQYQSNNLPRLLTSCGHTFCENCLDTMMAQSEDGGWNITCPEDGETTELSKGGVKQFPKNIALVKAIQYKNCNQNSSKSEQVIKEDQGKTVGKKQEEQQNTSITQAKTPQQTTNINFDEDLQNYDENNVCLLHQKQLDVVCLFDLEKICAKCAIFGQHKGHEFKSLESIENQADVYGEEILKIISEKEDTEKRINNESIKKEILNLLFDKKNKIQKEIEMKFKRLFERIKKMEDKVLKQLESIINKNEAKIRKEMEVEKQFQRQYCKWEEESFRHMLICSDGIFQEKLSLLYGQNSITGDIIDQGINLNQKLHKKEINTLNNVESVLDNIVFEFDDDIHNKIEGFAIVWDRIENPKIEKEKEKVEKEYEISCINGPSQTKLDKSEDQQEDNKNVKNKIAHNSNFNQQSLLELLGEGKGNKSQKSIVSPKTSQITSNVSTPQREGGKYVIPSSSNQKPKEIFKTQQVQQFERPSKKKLKQIKVPQKIEKILLELYNDTLQILDLTNSQLGETTILQISEFIRGSKVKSLKLIRNKLSDECLLRLLPALDHIITLNLSQNLFTERALDIFYNNQKQLPHLKSLILSQNKIIERKHKFLIEKLRKIEWTVSV